MTDRELLELASKAAGIEFDGRFGCFYDGHLKPWNPLTDDDDALRLAVKLGVDIYVDDGKSEVWVTESNHPIEHFDNDPYAATRRAIVRAAAEIGKEMK